MAKRMPDRTLCPDEFERLMKTSTAQTPDGFDCVLYACYTLGLRVESSRSLVFGDFSDNFSRLVIPARRVKGGTAAQEFTVAHREYRAALTRRWLDNADKPLSLRNKIRVCALSYRQLRLRLDKALEEAGIPRRTGADAVTWHTMRRSFATLAYRASGNDIKAVQGLLYHANLATTMKYIKGEHARATEIMGKLWNAQGERNDNH